MKQQFSQWLRTSNRAAVFRAAYEKVDEAVMSEPSLRGDLIMVITRHASKAHHECDEEK